MQSFFICEEKSSSFNLLSSAEPERSKAMAEAIKGKTKSSSFIAKIV